MPQPPAPTWRGFSSPTSISSRYSASGSITHGKNQAKISTFNCLTPTKVTPAERRLSPCGCKPRRMLQPVLWCRSTCTACLSHSSSVAAEELCDCSSAATEELCDKQAVQGGTAVLSCHCCRCCLQAAQVMWQATPDGVTSAHNWCDHSNHTGSPALGCCCTDTIFPTRISSISTRGSSASFPLLPPPLPPAAAWNVCVCV